MPGITAQIGYKTESVYNTPVVVDRFAEFTSEGIVPQTVRLQSNGLRAGGSTIRNNAIPFVQGYEGPVALTPLSKGWGFWLAHMLGSVATAGPTDSAYTHTGTIATLSSKSFTFQVGRPQSTGTVDPYTFAGCKIPSWELSCDTNALLQFSATVNAKACATGTALATASYPSGTVEPFAFIGASLTVGGASVTAKSFRCSVNQALMTDRNYLGTVHAEPLRNDWVSGTWEAVLDYDASTQWTKITASAAASAHAQIIATFQAPTLIGVSAYPTITVTIPAARFDGDGPVVPGPGMLEFPVKGVITDDGTNSPITVAYKSLDATP